ncbi:HipA domain-containing protein [Pontiella sulfatireligans]|uniref:Serine/threonine-protein kinase HipA n=1 Tax=Pontiella sulfatireligans TaxID=2750658 RepID=A0A6C2UNV9_9BACT|nr:HipA domain-containing protein [Pontiella sulfatireligans]VGO21952.1 Serine/threonine-protein kinase HipA [Pontiella sulfatireligans]
MNNSTCHICLLPLENGKKLYHASCCKKLFGSTKPPNFPYAWDELNKLAEQVISQHITIPGVQPKLSVHLETGGRTRDARLTLVGLEGGYILKPTVAEYPEMPELEHVTMRMAGCFGIAAAECGLIPMEGGQLAFITKRMDRIGNAKLHMEDMCQLTDKLTEQKYRGSTEQVGRAILKYCDNALFDALRFFETVLFSFLTGNSDMHLKNFSLLYKPGGAIGLSPAYDLLPTQLLLPEDTEESALTINGRKRRIGRNDFQRLAESLRLNEKQVLNVFSRFTTNLDEALRLLDSGLCGLEMKAKYKSLIQERAEHLSLT